MNLVYQTANGPEYYHVLELVQMEHVFHLVFQTGNVMLGLVVTMEFRLEHVLIGQIVERINQLQLSPVLTQSIQIQHQYQLIVE